MNKKLLFAAKQNQSFSIVFIGETYNANAGSDSSGNTYVNRCLGYRYRSYGTLVSSDISLDACYAVLENIRSGASWRNYKYFSLILYGNNGAFSLNDSVSITRVDTNETITGTFTYSAWGNIEVKISTTTFIKKGEEGKRITLQAAKL